MRTEKKLVHGQWVDVKVYPPAWASGASRQSLGRISNKGRITLNGGLRTERTDQYRFPVETPNGTLWARDKKQAQNARQKVSTLNPSERHRGSASPNQTPDSDGRNRLKAMSYPQSSTRNLPTAPTWLRPPGSTEAIHMRLDSSLHVA